MSGCSLPTPEHEAQPWAPRGVGGGTGLRKPTVCSHPLLAAPSVVLGPRGAEGGDPDLVTRSWCAPDAQGRLAPCGPSRTPHRPPAAPSPLALSLSPGYDPAPLCGTRLPGGSLLGSFPLRKLVNSRGVIRRRCPDEACLRAVLPRPCPATPGACRRPPSAPAPKNHPLLSQELLECPRPGRHQPRGKPGHLLHKSPGFRETPGVPCPPALPAPLGLRC